MTNIKNHNFTGIDYRIDYSDYYDFFLNTDALNNINESVSPIASFTFSADSNNIISLSEWSGASTSDITAFTYGLTALDNGSIEYDQSVDDVANNDLLNIFTGTTLSKFSGDTKLTLKKVSGYTGNFDYPINFIENSGSTGNYINFCGGFYQGYYKLDGYDYEVLPSRYESGWTIETLLNKSDSVADSFTGYTLNDKYVNNRGFFYYIGTRAENKFWNIFTGNTSSGCTDNSSNFCMDIKETDVNINNIIVDGKETNVSVPLSPPPVDVKEIKNNFLIFGRSEGVLCSNRPSKDGYGQVRAGRDFDRSTLYYSTIVKEEIVNFTNPFLIFGRSEGLVCGNGESEDGYGQVRADRNFSGMTTPILELNKDSDLIDNALGFRIKDDGSIGYRLLTIDSDCESVKVVEEYSDSGLVNDNEWTHVVIKWVNNESYTNCELFNKKTRKGRFKIYINSNLIFTSKELNEMVFKRLDDLSEKQISVPFNISIGGGSQGLLESITFDGQDSEDLGLLIEKNFAGSFIGSMSKFNIYNKNLSWGEIKKLYNSNG